MESLLLSILKPQARRCTIADLGSVIFQINEKTVRRSDFIQQQVPFSFYEVADHAPTVLYIHSYNSNRLQPLTLFNLLLQHNFNVASIELQRVQFDEQLQRMIINPEGMVSFGHYECQQVLPVVNWLKKRSSSKLYLWGRSMGAVTSLLYQSKYSGADGLILDSPFHSLHEIFVSQFTQLTNLPRILGQGVMLLVSVTFQNLLRFSLSELDILNTLSIDCPVFMIANPKDLLAGKSCNLIYDQLKGMRKILYSEAEHSASRERIVLIEIITQLSKLHKVKKLFHAKSVQKIYQASNKTQESQEPKTKKRVYLKLMQVKSSKALVKTIQDE